MKYTIFIIIIVLSCALAKADTTNYNSVNDTAVSLVQKNTEEIHYCKNQNDVGSLTLAVNAINNIMTWSAVMIAALTLLVAVFGIIGYIRIKDILKDNIKKVSDKIIEINSKEQVFNTCIAKTEAITKELQAQEQYMCNSNVYIHKALETIANQISDDHRAISILKFILHNYQISSLYSSNASLKFAALAYLQDNGTFNDIEHLEYVSNFDLIEANKTWAREIIGIIKNKKR